MVLSVAEDLARDSGQIAGGRHGVVSTVLFLIGTLLGTAFLAATTWAGLEASLFNPTNRGDAVLRTMTCPLVLTKGETGTVTATFYNPGPNPTSPTVRTITSFGSVSYHGQADRRFLIQPGETVKQEWEIDADRPVWGALVFVRLYQFASYPLSSSSGYCGILVLDLPFTKGATLVATAISVSLLCLAGGLALRLRGSRSAGKRQVVITRAMVVLASLVTLGLFVPLVGSWLIGLAVLIFVILLGGVLLAMVLSGE